MDGVARWWDGTELWATGLPFVAQVAVVLVVAAPLCAVAARALDRVVGLGAKAVGAVRPERDVSAPSPRES